MMSLWDALRMNMMISYQELVRTFPKCEAKGISRDVCYHEEKEYWNNYSANMSRLQAANTQADAFKESMSDRKKNKHYDDD
ncbi:hypothetical protein ACTM6T_25645 [Citrobacter freundii]